MTTPAHDEAVAGLSAYVAANPSPFRDRGLLSERVELDDEAPVPSLAELCRCNNGMPCGEDTCVCGEPVARFASSWWHTHGRRDHHATPAVERGNK
jgi:hypothetical protein